MSCPTAVLIGGAPATGKSTLARAVGPLLCAAILDLDVCTGPLSRLVADLIGASDLGEAKIANLTRAARYETLTLLAEDNLRAGMSVLLVAPFTAERHADAWAVLSQRLGLFAADVKLVWLELPPPELVRRLTQRAAWRDQEKVRTPSAFLASLDRSPPSAPHLLLGASQDVPTLVASVLEYVKT